MFLAEAALGRQYSVNNDNREAQRYQAAPPGHDSVVTTSRTQLNPRDDVVLKIDGNDVKFATGRPEEVPVRAMQSGAQQIHPSSFYQAEYLCYDAAQVRLRYLVLVGPSKAAKSAAAVADASNSDTGASGGGGGVGAGAAVWYWASVRCSRFWACVFTRGCGWISFLPSVHSAMGDRVHGLHSRIRLDLMIALLEFSMHVAQ